MDAYCDAYILRNGNRDIYNYLHVIQAGHIRHQIRRFGNLFRYANIGFEAYIGTIRNYLTRRTQNGGNGGKGVDQKQQTHAQRKGLQLGQVSTQWKLLQKKIIQCGMMVL